jgi:hypothetical protein
VSWLYVTNGYVASNGVSVYSKQGGFADWWRQLFGESMERTPIYTIELSGVTIECHNRETMDEMVAKLDAKGLRPINYERVMADTWKPSEEHDGGGFVPNQEDGG